MTLNIQAVYQGGLLRPLAPLPLVEGETVELTVTKTAPVADAPTDDEVIRRIKEAKTISEWVEATKLLPPDDGGYDIVKALNENRIWSGEIPRIPAEGKPS